MDENAVNKIQLAYLSTGDSTYFGINSIYGPGTWSTVLSKQASDDDLEVPPYIAISATHLADVYLWPSNAYEKYQLNRIACGRRRLHLRL